MEKNFSIYVHYCGDNRIQHISLWSDSTNGQQERLVHVLRRYELRLDQMEADDTKLIFVKQDVLDRRDTETTYFYKKAGGEFHTFLLSDFKVI